MTHTRVSPQIFAWGDILVFSVLVSVVWLGFGHGAAVEVGAITIRAGDGTMVTVGPRERRTVTVEGVLGPVIVQIDNGSARIVKSGCPKQICVHSGTIQTPGQQLVCVPNHVLVEIVPESKEGSVDAIAR